MESENTFSSEMHQDNAPLAQPDNTAREIINMRIIGNDGDNYSLVDLHGTIVSFQCNPGYIPCGFKNYPALLGILAFNPTIGRSEIGVVEIDSITKIGTYDPIYVNSDLDFDLEHMIEVRGIRETLNEYIIYFWDNKNRMKVFNIADARFSATFGLSSLSIGGRYMVTQGTIVHNAVNYGPNETDNIFTAVATTYTIPSGSAKVIEYIPIEAFSIIPKVGFEMPRLIARIVGQLTCGTYYYFYRLTDDKGNGTGYSMPSAPVYINNVVLGNLMLDANMDGGEQDVQTVWGARMEIEYVDPNYTKAELVFVKAIDENSFEDPILFDIVDINGTALTFDHTTNTGSPIAPDDLILYQLPIIKNKTGDINKNTLVIGNFELQADPNYDLSAQAVGTFIPVLIPCDETEVQYGINPRMTVDADMNIPLYGVHHTPLGGAPENTITGGSGMVGTWYEVTAGTIRLTNVLAGTASGNIVGPLYFQWPNGPGYDSWTTVSGTPELYPVIQISKYAQEYRYVRIENDYYSDGGMLVNHYIKSAWRGETYRVGLTLIDTFGNPLYVHHLFDATVPEWALTDTIDNSNNVGSIRQYRTRLLNLILGVSGLNFNLILDGLKEIENNPALTLADLPSYFSGFSIVLCKRDEQTVAEGIISPVTLFTPWDSYVTSPAPDATFDNLLENTGNRTLNMFFLRSPDLTFGINDVPIEFEESDYLEIKRYLALHNPDLLYKGTKLYDLNDRFDFYYGKWYKDGVPLFNGVGAKNNINVEYSKIFLAPPDTALVGPQNKNFTMRTRVSQGTLTQCFIPSQFTNTYEAQRNHGAFVYTKNDGTTAGFFGYDEMHQPDPALGKQLPVYVSYKKRKVALYGGDGAVAKSQNEYFFAGHYQRLDAAFMNYLAYNGGLANEIHVTFFDCNVQLWDTVFTYPDNYGTSGFGYGMILPIQSKTKIRFREGRNFAHEGVYLQGIFNGPIFNADGVLYSRTQTALPYLPEQLVSNRSYRSTNAWNVPLLAVPYEYKPRRFYEKTFAFSLRKTDGEIRDNLRRFIPGNTKDLDNQYGAITNLKTKNGYLTFLQENAFGYIPIQERVTIANAVGLPINIGTKDTIDEYQTTQTFYGSRNQFSLTEDETGLYWYDGEKKTICKASINGETIAVTVVKGLWAFFRSKSYVLPEGDTPLTQMGVIAGYDDNFKEILFTFMGIKKALTGETVNFTLAINALNGNMRGFFSTQPGIYIKYNGDLLSSGLKYDYPVLADSTAYTEGTIVKSATNPEELYVVTADFTTTTPAVDAKLEPNCAYFRSDNDVHLHNVGDICNFYGLVYDSSVEFVAKSKDLKEAIFNSYNADINGSDVMFTNLEARTTKQSGSDLDIETSREHAIVDNHIEGSLPLDTKGERFTSPFLIVKFVKDHKVDLITSNNEKAELLKVNINHIKAY